MYDPHSEQAMVDLKAMGFTQVILDQPQLHKAASNAGLDVVLANWWTQDTKTKQIETAIGRAREVANGALVGFSVMDEPGRNSPDTPFDFYRDLYEELKPRFAKQFPRTRLEISHWGPMAGWNQRHYDEFAFLYEAADVMRIMPYPDLKEAPLDDVFFMIQRSRRIMKDVDRQLPLVVILQTWLLPPDGTLPEIDELRVMAWQAMLPGTETLSFFEYNLDIWNRTPDFHGQFEKLMIELTSLARRHKSSRVETTMSEDGILTSVLRAPDGGLTQITINTRRHAVGAMGPLQIRESTLHSGRRYPPWCVTAVDLRWPSKTPRTRCWPIRTTATCCPQQQARCQPQPFRLCW